MKLFAAPRHFRSVVSGRILCVTGILAGILLPASAQPAATASKQVNCDAEFATVMEDIAHYPDLPSRTRRWEALARNCQGTGLYEARLSTLYMQAGRFDEARNIAQQGLKKKTGYEKNLRLALHGMDFRQGKLAESERQALALIKDFPDWNGGYIGLGETRLVEQRFLESIENLERAVALEPNGGAYVLLTMAYFKVSRFLDSARAMQQALNLDGKALKHTEAVCATAHSLMTLDRLPKAEELLNKHLEVRPAAANDPAFKAATTRLQREKVMRSSPQLARNQQFTEAALEGLRLQTSGHARVWHLGKEKTWSADLKAGEIVFEFENGVSARTSIQVVGTHNTADGTFLWAWDHPSIPEPLRKHARLARQYGESNGAAAFTERKVVVSEEAAWALAAVTNRLAGANGVYRGRQGTTLVFVTLGEIALEKPTAATAAKPVKK